MGLVSYKTDPKNPLLIILFRDRRRMIILKMRLFTNVVHLFLPLALSILLLSASTINGLEGKDAQKQQSSDATNCQNQCHGNPLPPPPPPPPQGPQPSLPEPLPLPLPPPPPSSNENTPPPPCNQQCCQNPPNSGTDSPPNSDTDSPPSTNTNTPPMPYTYLPSSSSRLPPSFDTFLLLLLLLPLLRCGTILQC